MATCNGSHLENFRQNMVKIEWFEGILLGSVESEMTAPLESSGQASTRWHLNGDFSTEPTSILISWWAIPNTLDKVDNRRRMEPFTARAFQLAIWIQLAAISTQRGQSDRERKQNDDNKYESYNYAVFMQICHIEEKRRTYNTLITLYRARDKNSPAGSVN